MDTNFIVMPNFKMTSGSSSYEMYKSFLLDLQDREENALAYSFGSVIDPCGSFLKTFYQNEFVLKRITVMGLFLTKVYQQN